VLPRYQNVLVGRTFSKAYGLAGMRVGIVIGQPPALQPVRDVTLPFNINVIALTAVKAALRQTRSFFHATRLRSASPASGCIAACRRLGLQYWESAAIMCSCAWRDGASHPGALGAEDSRSGSIEGSGHAGMRGGSPPHGRAHHCGIEALESVVAVRQAQ